MADAEKALRNTRSRREHDRNKLFAGLRMKKKEVKRVFNIVHNRGELEEGDADLIADVLLYTWMKISQAEHEEIEMDLTVEGNGDESE